jgi:hypothetical protein
MDDRASLVWRRDIFADFEPILAATALLVARPITHRIARRTGIGEDRPETSKRPLDRRPRAFAFKKLRLESL